MESNNTFESGMVSDVSKIYMSNKQYLEALNMRPVTNKGESNGALVNIQGNNCEVKFPVMRSTYKLKLNRQFAGTTFLPGVITITVNGQTTGNITINENTTTLDIYTNILNLSNAYNEVYSNTKTFAVAYNEDFVTIYQMPELRFCVSATSIEPTITINQISGTSGLLFVRYDETTSSTSVPYIPEVSATDPITIIGSTAINDINYLYTCPFTNPDKLGQIWELRYTSSNETILKLIYTNKLNFSVNFPIPPTASEGRYEVPTVQRIYWTDNNNPIRSINVIQPNLMTFDPTLIDLAPSVEMSIPTLYNVIAGSAINNLSTASTYQCAYRLVQNNGALTNYSIPSNIVQPILLDTDLYKGATINYSGMDGKVGSVNKAIEFTVSGIDTTYDIIEFFIVVRENVNYEDYRVYKYEEQLIGGQTNIRTVFTNDLDTMEEISLGEFLIQNVSFTHCKTIEQKNNRLFLGNVKNKMSTVLQEYDTRTFRYPTASTSITIKNFETDTTTSVHTSYSTILSNYDAIPIYNLGLSTDDDPLFSGLHKYQRNSGIIGGTGPNISYKFGNILLKSDSTPLAPGISSPGSYEEGTTRDNNSPTMTYENGYRKAGVSIAPYSKFLPTYTNLAPDQTYYTNTIKESMGFEYFSGMFKTGQHNEIYRYGIVFTSKNGSDSFTKWIGDIKFPNYNDTVAPGLEAKSDLGNTVGDFRSMYYDASGAYCNLPYIQFEVIITEELAREISGYQIVRVERKNEDRVIREHGLINQVVRKTAVNDTALPRSIQPSMMDPVTGSTSSTAPNDVLTYHGFSYLCDASTSITAGDKLIITEKFSRTNLGSVWPRLTAPIGINIVELDYISKFYTHGGFVYNGLSTAGASTLKVKESAYVNIDDAINLNTISKTYNNRGPDGESKGCPTIAVAIDTTFQAINWATYQADSTFTTSSKKVMALHFKPSFLKSQYGGRTFFARQANEYISCGAYYNVTEAGATSIKVFGGDIYHGIIDLQKAIRLDASAAWPDGTSHTFYYPTQSRYNVDQRIGFHVNSDFNDSYPSAIDNEIYGSQQPPENVINKYIAEPFAFNETNTFFNRVYWTNDKINGETTDSWSIIPINNYYDIDGAYGEINSLIMLKNELYCLQNRALSLLLVNPYTVTPEGTILTLNTSSGKVLEKHNYIALDVGTKHQWSVSDSSTAITFMDINRKKIYLFNGSELNPISDTKGQRGTINDLLTNSTIVSTDNPIINRGLLTTYDFSNNEFLYTFLNGEFDKKTLVYSDLIGAFSSFYSFTPYIYINNHINIYSPDTLEQPKLYLHNIGGYGNFYSGIYPSSIKVNINPNPLYTKVFDNLSWISEAIEDFGSDKNYIKDTFDNVRCYNETQNSDWTVLDQTPITGNLRKAEQTFNIQVPRNKVNLTSNQSIVDIFDPAILTKTEFKERMRDKYMIVDLEYLNSENIGLNRFVIHNLKSTYRVSDR